MTPLDPDRTLALSYVPAKHRPAVEALWRLDAALGAVLAGGREPLIGQIKLVWWRDALEKLDRERAPAEPVLRAVAEHVVPIVPGAALAEFEQAWTVLLNQEPLSSSDFDDYAARGRLLFRFSATLLGDVSTAEVEDAGEAWALVDLARHSGEPDKMAVFNAARERARPRNRWPVPLRPLGMLHALARRDIEYGLGTQGSPGRMLRMLRHRFTGR
ncbi:squalene/phytoene synthase family protein [Allosphingosinicella sp.]|uniref:squalene/phytoene synthase family protein n=1 Tax=Allosphingosinicella sp. TaxID=2823234 RepID=UPI002FC1D99C